MCWEESLLGAEVQAGKEAASETPDGAVWAAGYVWRRPGLAGTGGSVVGYP